MGKVLKFVKICTMTAVCIWLAGAGVKARAAGPDAASGLKQEEAGTNRVKVSWDAVIGNNIQYKVELCANKNFAGGVMNNLTFNNRNQITGATTIPQEYFSGLTAGKKYYVRVTAFTSTGYPNYACSWGRPSEVLEVVTSPADSAVKNFKQTKAGTTSITLSWDKYSGANAYQLAYARAGSNDMKTIQLKNVTSYKVKKLNKNTEYNFRIWPVLESSSGFCAVGGSGKALLGCAVLPGKVTGVECAFWSPESKYLDLEWNKREAADGYQYQIFAEGQKKPLVSGKKSGNTEKTSVTSKKLKEFRFFKLRVCGYIDVNGSSQRGGWSSWTYFSRQPKVTLKNTKSGMKVTWNKVSGATSYTVYISSKRNRGYQKAVTISNTSCIVSKCGKSKLKSGKTYYFMVAANKRMAQKTFHSTKNYCFWRTYRK